MTIASLKANPYIHIGLLFIGVYLLILSVALANVPVNDWYVGALLVGSMTAWVASFWFYNLRLRHKFELAESFGKKAKEQALGRVQALGLPEPIAAVYAEKIGAACYWRDIELLTTNAEISAMCLAECKTNTPRND